MARAVPTARAHPSPRRLSIARLCTPGWRREYELANERVASLSSIPFVISLPIILLVALVDPNSEYPVLEVEAQHLHDGNVLVMPWLKKSCMSVTLR